MSAPPLTSASAQPTRDAQHRAVNRACGPLLQRPRNSRRSKTPLRLHLAAQPPILGVSCDFLVSLSRKFIHGEKDCIGTREPNAVTKETQAAGLNVLTSPSE